MISKTPLAGHSDSPTTAYFLIYTNVRPHLSPNGQSGWQILLQSKGFPREEVDEVHSLLTQYPAEYKQPKYLYTTRTDSGSVIIARYVPLNDTDEQGRGGIHLAQALLLSPETFAACGYNPFALLNNVKFYDTPDDAIRYYGTSRDKPAPLELNIQRLTNTPLPDEPELWQRMRLFLRLAESLREKNMSQLRIKGSSDNIRRVLNYWFAVMPEELREVCTFDTASVQRNEEQQAFIRLISTTGAVQTDPAVVFDCDHLTISGQLPTSKPSRFLTWMCESKDGQSLTPDASSLRKLRAAYYLDRFLADRICSQHEMTDVDESLLRSFGVNRDDIVRRLGVEIAHCLKTDYAPVKEMLLPRMPSDVCPDLVERIRSGALLRSDEWHAVVDTIWKECEQREFKLDDELLRKIVKKAATADIIPANARNSLALMEAVLSSNWSSTYTCYWDEPPADEYRARMLEFMLGRLKRFDLNWCWAAYTAPDGNKSYGGPGVKCAADEEEGLALLKTVLGFGHRSGTAKSSATWATRLLALLKTVLGLGGAVLQDPSPINSPRPLENEQVAYVAEVVKTLSSKWVETSPPPPPDLAPTFLRYESENSVGMMNNTFLPFPYVLLPKPPIKSNILSISMLTAGLLLLVWSIPFALLVSDSSAIVATCLFCARVVVLLRGWLLAVSTRRDSQQAASAAERWFNGVKAKCTQQNP